MGVATGLVNGNIVDVLLVGYLGRVAVQPRIHFLETQGFVTGVALGEARMERILIVSSLIALEVTDQRLIVVAFEAHLVGVSLKRCLVAVKHIYFGKG